MYAVPNWSDLRAKYPSAREREEVGECSPSTRIRRGVAQRVVGGEAHPRWYAGAIPALHGPRSGKKGLARILGARRNCCGGLQA